MKNRKPKKLKQFYKIHNHYALCTDFLTDYGQQINRLWQQEPRVLENRRYGKEEPIQVTGLQGVPWLSDTLHPLEQDSLQILRVGANVSSKMWTADKKWHSGSGLCLELTFRGKQIRFRNATKSHSWADLCYDRRRNGMWRQVNLTSDLVGVWGGVRSEKVGSTPTDYCTFFYRNGNTNNRLETGIFSYKEIIPPVGACDRDYLYSTVLNAHALNREDSYHEQPERVFKQSTT
jgi:hypothetical protein